MNKQDGSVATETFAAEDRETFEALLQPIVAGAHARGVAETLDLLGLPAVLIDPSGRVLHASPAAMSLLAPSLRIAGGALLGRDPQTRELIAVLLSQIGPTPTAEPTARDLSVAGENGAVVRLRVVRFPPRDATSMARVAVALLVSAGTSGA